MRRVPHQVRAARNLRLPPAPAAALTVQDFRRTSAAMRTVPVLTGAEAARLIADSDVITVSSSSALGCPDAVLEAIGERYAETGSPADLTSLHPIAAGDMYGIKGIDHLCRPGQLRRVLADSYPSGGSKLDPPLVRELIHNDQIQALNIPSGVLFRASSRLHWAAGRNDRSRAWHLRGSAAGGCQDERRYRGLR